jgi:hypothetical protein
MRFAYAMTRHWANSWSVAGRKAQPLQGTAKLHAWPGLHPPGLFCLVDVAADGKMAEGRQMSFSLVVRSLYRRSSEIVRR